MKIIKNLIQDKDFYKNSIMQLSSLIDCIQKKLMSSNNKLEEIR